jgi:hypothetical protein
MDTAYAQAEAVLNDEAARAARRARVLAAVAREPARPPVASSPRTRRLAWRGGWLVAASIAGLSLFLATRIYPPASNPQQTANPQPTAPTAPAAPAPAAREIAALPTPAARAPSQTPKPAPRTFAAAPRAAPRSSGEPPPTAPSPAAAPVHIAEASGTPGAATPAPSEGLSELVVTAGRRASPLGSSPPIRSSAGSPPDPAAKLRAAASAGQTAEVAALLAKGVPVDAPDDSGETALMRAIQAHHPAAAALLRRGGASLDRKNDAGASARDMATSIGDPELNRALGLP